MNNEPGSRENSLPVPLTILQGKAFWTGMPLGDNLFWCRDDGLTYRFPDDPPTEWDAEIAEVSRQIGELNNRLIDLSDKRRKKLYGA